MRLKYGLNLLSVFLVLFLLGQGSALAQTKASVTKKSEPTISEIAHKYALNHKEMVILVSVGRKPIKAGNGKIITGQDIGNTIKKYLETEEEIPAKVFVRKANSDGTGLTLIINNRSYDIFNLKNVKKKLEKPILVFRVKFPNVKHKF